MVNKIAAFAVVLLLIGGLFVLIQTQSGGAGSGVSEVASTPPACNAGYVINSVAEDAAGVVSYNCIAQNAAEAASTPAACATHFVVNQVNESSAGVIAYKCIQLAFSDLSGTDTPTWANIQSFPSGCATHNWIATIGVTPTCSQPAFGDISGVAAWAQIPAGKYVSTQPASEALTSASGKMFGFASSTGASVFTPSKTGNMIVIFEGDCKVGTANFRTQIQSIQEGTGTAPTNGAALTGSALSTNQIVLTSATAGAQVPFTFIGFKSGLTLNTQYWFDLYGDAPDGGTATCADMTFVVLEISN